MSRERSMVAGDTDYAGYPLPDLLRHLGDWRDNTNAAIAKLKNLRQEAETKRTLLANPKNIIGHCDHFIDMFERYASDFDRLLEGIPDGVRPNHIEILKQLFDSSREQDRICLEFRNESVHRSLPHEEMRYLLDSIYSETRQQVIDYQDLASFTHRLTTFVGD